VRATWSSHFILFDLRYRYNKLLFKSENMLPSIRHKFSKYYLNNFVVCCTDLGTYFSKILQYSVIPHILHIYCILYDVSRHNTVVLTFFNSIAKCLKKLCLTDLYKTCLYPVFSYLGQAVAQFVEALRYKSEGRGLYSRWCHWNFNWHNPSGRTTALGWT
jgi:hypothetical protein